MKQLLLLSSFVLLSVSSFGQGQFENADFELWENIGSATEEPENWSGIKTASGNGTLISFAPQAITRSTDTPSGSGYSVQLESNTVFGTVANGTVTCGRLNVGSATASDPSNYSYTDTGDAAWSQALTDTPDSIVWWAKFTAADTVAADSARMKATLHDDYNYQDPEDATSSMHVVATAVKNYPHTGMWVRYSAPFDYSGPLSNNTYILVTFTTNKTPGGGSGGDVVLIDDVELIYNQSNIGIEENDAEDVVVAMDNVNNQLVVKSASDLSGNYTIVNSAGQIVQEGQLAAKIAFEAESGVYFLHIEGAKSSHQFVKF